MSLPAGAPGRGRDRASSISARRRSPDGAGCVAASEGALRAVGVAVVVVPVPPRRVLKATPGCAGVSSFAGVAGEDAASGPAGRVVCAPVPPPGGGAALSGPVVGAARGSAPRLDAGYCAASDRVSRAVSGALALPVARALRAGCGGVGIASASSEVGGNGASGGGTGWSAPRSERGGRIWGRLARARKAGIASGSPDSSAWIASSSAKGSSTGSTSGSGASSGSRTGVGAAAEAGAGLTSGADSGSAGGCQARSPGEWGAACVSGWGG